MYTLHEKGNFVWQLFLDDEIVTEFDLTLVEQANIAIDIARNIGDDFEIAIALHEYGIAMIEHND